MTTLLVVVLIVVASMTHMQVAVADETITINVGAVSSLRLPDRRDAYWNIMAQRDELIRTLLANVQTESPDPKWGSTFYYSIRLLGELRAEEAVGALAAHLTYLPVGNEFSSESLPQEYYYPSALALTNIGGPALESVLSIITVPNDKLKLELAYWVIMTIDGKEQAVHRLDDLTAKAPWLKAHYEAAKSYILAWKPILRRPDAPVFFPKPASKAKTPGSPQ